MTPAVSANAGPDACRLADGPADAAAVEAGDIVGDVVGDAAADGSGDEAVEVALFTPIRFAGAPRADEWQNCRHPSKSCRYGDRMRAVPGIVALAVIADMPMFELSIACEIFGTDRRELTDPWYELRLCAARPGTTRTQNGFALHTPYDFHTLTTADTVVVPAISADAVLAGDVGRMGGTGGTRNADDTGGAAGITESGLPEALREAHANGARIVSLCTGAFVLAAAGLLDGRRATTHWMYTGILSARHPRVRVDPAVLYVDEGDVLTSAGRTAGIDLCLHLVRTDLGAEVANQVARRMVTPAHRPGGQAQYIEAPVPRSGDDGLAPVLQWALERLHEQLTVAQMAAWASVSARTLVRRFHAATGTTPLRWLHAQRLARARHLLETTDLPIERISRMCGMGTAGNLRHHFVRSVGVTPADYRRTFQSGRAVSTSAPARIPYSSTGP